MRAPFLAGALAGLLVAVVAVAAVLAGLQPRTIAPSAQASAAVSTSPGASGSGSAGAATVSASPAANAPPVGIHVGDRAPALKLPALGGGTIDLAANRGKPTWVSFTASWCPSCRDELGLMNSFRGQLGDRMAMLVVDVKEDPDTVASLVSATNIQAPVGLDRDGTASAAWQAYVLPVHYWVDGQGIVRSVLYGAAPPDAFIHGIQTVLPGASLSP
ncbi:MAG: TlpA family protein disulfide reductase [Candidatus Limnocylindrales bacterium]